MKFDWSKTVICLAIMIFMIVMIYAYEYPRQIVLGVSGIATLFGFIGVSRYNFTSQVYSGWGWSQTTICVAILALTLFSMHHCITCPQIAIFFLGDAILVGFTAASHWSTS